MAFRFRRTQTRVLVGLDRSIRGNVRIGRDKVFYAGVVCESVDRIAQRKLTDGEKRPRGFYG